MYAIVIVEIGVKKVDKTFTYKIPSEYIDKIKIGIRVKVPFGKMILEGFVINIFDNYKEDYEVNEIIELVDLEPILNNEMLKLADYITETTLCSKISAYQVMLPKALKAKNKVELDYCCCSITKSCLTPCDSMDCSMPGSSDLH